MWEEKLPVSCCEILIYRFYKLLWEKYLPKDCYSEHLLEIFPTSCLLSVWSLPPRQRVENLRELSPQKNVCERSIRKQKGDIFRWHFLGGDISRGYQENSEVTIWGRSFQDFFRETFCKCVFRKIMNHIQKSFGIFQSNTGITPGNLERGVGGRLP